jgi:predicted nuclease of predicted toxin-antitoxin system
MRFLVDAQLPPALARWLAEKGHDARHVADVGLA